MEPQIPLSPVFSFIGITAQETNILFDINLPEWGPFTKWYAGISHIADHEKGLRFDLSVFPGYYRRRIDVPNVMWESGYHPWESAADLSYYSMRYDLENLE